MDFDCHLPMFGPTATRETILGFARRMEALGYDSLWSSDHVVVPCTIESRYPYRDTGKFPLPPECPAALGRAGPAGAAPGVGIRPPRGS